MYHVFISYPDKNSQWIHAYPPNGVESFHQFDRAFFPPSERYTLKIEIFSAPAWVLPTESYQVYFGKKFDRFYHGDNQHTTYCSKMVGELLGIPTTPFEDDPTRRGISVKNVYDFLHKNSLFQKTRVLYRLSPQTPFQELPHISCQSLLL